MNSRHPVDIAIAWVVNLMDFKNFAVASTTFQDVPNTPLEKMIPFGSAFILDLYIPCLVPVRRFPSPSRSIRFGDVSEANGQETFSHGPRDPKRFGREEK